MFRIISSMYDYDFQHQLGYIPSYLALPARLEIAIAPRRNMSRYANKPLPPIPPPLSKSSHEVLQHHGSTNSVDIISTRRVSTFPSVKKSDSRRASIQKIQKLLWHNLDHVDEKPINDLPGGNIYRTSTAAPQLPPVEGLSKLDNNGHMDTFSDIRRQLRSNSQTSLTSVSVYSQEENTVEEIVDIYSKWGSWAPDPQSSNNTSKKSLYLQPAVYSASAIELGQSNNAVDSRPPNRLSIDEAQIYPKAITLVDLIREERERLGTYGPLNKTRVSPLKPISPVHDQSPASANVFEHSPWSAGNNHRRDLLPQPLALRPRSFEESHRSMSRWSSHSSEEGGILSNARDSVISHIRSIPSPFKVPSRPSIVFKEKTEISTIRIPPPKPMARKRAFSSSRHPLKSPFPLRSPVHKKLHLSDHSDVAQNSFVRRVSDSFKHFSSSRKTPTVDYQVISNHARTGDGPDTPLPIKPGFKAMLSPTAVFFQKSNLQIQGAVNKAKSVAKAMSREERRKGRLRKKIFVVGTTNPNPSVSRWV